MDDFKVCTKCGETKPLEAFDKHHNTRDRLHPWCKPCRAAYARARSAANVARSESELLADWGRLHPSGQKTCPRCGGVFDRDCFASNRSSPDGRDPHCLGCGANRKRDDKARRAARTEEELAADWRRLRPSGLKACPMCHRKRPREGFPLQRTSADGRGTYCTDCNAARRRDEAASLSARTDAECDADFVRLHPDGKRCRAGHVAPMEDFYRDRARPSGRHDHCREHDDPRGLTRLAAGYATPDSACSYCGGKGEHWDHVIPLANGGPEVPGAIRRACASCNTSKGAKYLPEWLASRPDLDVPLWLRAYEQQLRAVWTTDTEPMQIMRRLLEASALKDADARESGMAAARAEHQAWKAANPPDLSKPYVIPEIFRGVTTAEEAEAAMAQAVAANRSA